MASPASCSCLLLLVSCLLPWFLRFREDTKQLALFLLFTELFAATCNAVFSCLFRRDLQNRIHGGRVTIRNLYVSFISQTLQIVFTSLGALLHRHGFAHLILIKSRRGTRRRTTVNSEDLITIAKSQRLAYAPHCHALHGVGDFRAQVRHFKGAHFPARFGRDAHAVLLALGVCARDLRKVGTGPQLSYEFQCSGFYLGVVFAGRT